MKLNIQKVKSKAKPVGVAPLGDPISKRNTQSGITLVALIITVIVLLILAMVSIRLTMNGGIIDRAERGTAEYTEAEIKEKIGTAYQEYKMSQYSNPITFEEALANSGLNGATVSEDGLTVSYRGKDYPITENGAVGNAKTEIKVLAGETAPSDSNVEYISNGKKAIVPAGYTVSNVEGETDIDTGLVIKKDGNEWVWIPVSNEDLMAMYTEDVNGWRMNGTTTENAVVTKYKSNSNIISGITRNNPGNNYGYREPNVLNNTSYDNNQINLNASGFDSYIDMATKLRDDYKNMIDSVKKYGGFYIGRYELGGTIIEPQEKAGTVICGTNWYDLYKACKAFGDEDITYSRMIWGCQWDQVCKFISTYKEGSEIKTRSLTNSCSYGNFCNSTGDAYTNCGDKNFNKITGRNQAWQANNIYDIAGNCLEWTQEINDTEYRAYRGGYCFGYGNTDSVTYRDCYNPTKTNNLLSSRPVIYIK